MVEWHFVTQWSVSWALFPENHWKALSVTKRFNFHVKSNCNSNIYVIKSGNKLKLQSWLVCCSIRKERFSTSDKNLTSRNNVTSSFNVFEAIPWTNKKQGSVLIRRKIQNEDCNNRRISGFLLVPLLQTDYTTSKNLTQFFSHTL